MHSSLVLGGLLDVRLRSLLQWMVHRTRLRSKRIRAPKDPVRAPKRRLQAPAFIEDSRSVVGRFQHHGFARHGFAHQWIHAPKKLIRAPRRFTELHTMDSHTEDLRTSPAILAQKGFVHQGAALWHRHEFAQNATIRTPQVPQEV